MYWKRVLPLAKAGGRRWRGVKKWVTWCVCTIIRWFQTLPETSCACIGQESTTNTIAKQKNKNIQIWNVIWLEFLARKWGSCITMYAVVQDQPSHATSFLTKTQCDSQLSQGYLCPWALLVRCFECERQTKNNEPTCGFGRANWLLSTSRVHTPQKVEYYFSCWCMVSSWEFHQTMWSILVERAWSVLCVMILCTPCRQSNGKESSKSSKFVKRHGNMGLVCDVTLYLRRTWGSKST